MAATKWQCRQCGVTYSSPNGLRPPVGSFCGQSKDHHHKWSKIIEKPTRWQCTKCGVTYASSNGLRPPVGSFCGRSSDKKHKWVKV